MNKETIYIEPENDITDIIAKIENAKEKIIALVPPKKAGVFRSVVNIKLIAKSAKNAEKTVVLVTVDPSIVKLAAASKLPVAKDLQSAPKIPTLDENIEEASSEDLPSEEDEETETEESPEDTENSKNSNSSENSKKDSKKAKDDEDENEDDEDEEKPEKPAKKPKSKKHKFLNWIKGHKAISIIAGVGGLALIAFLVWALFFAPAVKVNVAIKTESHNFAENVTFTLNAEDEDAKEGKFYLEEKKIESVQEIAFDATGQKNRGEKASGSVIFEHVFRSAGTYSIDSIAINGMNFSASPQSSISFDGNNFDQCDNIKNLGKNEAIKEYADNGCRKRVRVNVVAAEAGTKYNVPQSCGWMSLSGVSGCSEAAVGGGTDDIVTVVQQIDVENARNKLTEGKEDENKEKLYDSIDKDRYLIVEPSFAQETASPSATPAVDEEVKDGVKPILKTTTITKVYVIDKSKIKEYIDHKVDLRDDQKIYDIRNPYFENLTPIKDGYTSRLKANYYVGPKVTESEVVDKIKGKGLGNAQREIRDIEGVSDVTIDKSFPWVMAVPNDSNKVEVRFDIKDQNGDKLEEEKHDQKDQKENENQDKNQGNN